MSADVNTILEVKGCGLMKRFLADKTPEIREWYKQQAAKYKHLYPCPCRMDGGDTRSIVTGVSMQSKNPLMLEHQRVNKNAVHWLGQKGLSQT